MLQIREYTGMDVEAGGGREGVMKTGRSGTQWLTFEGIMIPTNQSMVMTIRGMPRHPSWKLWVPRIVGILVVVMMIAGVAFALTRQRQAVTTDAERKQALMNELVELEKSGADSKRRDQVLAELERLWT
jgi:hypothetical protein